MANDMGSGTMQDLHKANKATTASSHSKDVCHLELLEHDRFHADISMYILLAR